MIFILIGLFIDLGWKDISLNYQKIFQNQTIIHKYQPILSIKESTINLKEIIEGIEEEFNRMIELKNGWVLNWNDSSQSRRIESQPIYDHNYIISNNPIIKLTINCSCENPQSILKKILKHEGLLSLHPVNSSHFLVSFH